MKKALLFSREFKRQLKLIAAIYNIPRKIDIFIRSRNLIKKLSFNFPLINLETTDGGWL